LAEGWIDASREKADTIDIGGEFDGRE